MTGLRRRLITAAGAFFVLLAVVACGSAAEEDYISDTYDQVSTQGDTATYRSNDARATTTQKIASNEAPAARANDANADYLRYTENIVIVRSAGSGSEIVVEDLDGNFRNGMYSYLGPGFAPSDVADDGGPGDSK